MDYKIIYDQRTHLGEGIYWDDVTRAYYFVDIMRNEFHCLKDGVDTVLQTFDDFVGFTVPTTDGRFMVGCGRDLLLFDPITKTSKKMFSVDEEFSNNRFNDGKATPDGRIIAGTMNNALNEDDFAPNSDTGGLFSITAGEKPLRLMSGKKVPNGLAFSRDNKIMFHTDTFSQTIKAYAYDEKTGSIEYLRDVVKIPEELGSPDGMTISDDDTIFAALWGGGAVAVIDTKKGEITELIKLPVLHVTCCAFGGENLDELVVNTSSIDSPIEQYPDAGKIFKLNVGKKGKKTDRFDLKEETK